MSGGGERKVFKPNDYTSLEELAEAGQRTTAADILAAEVDDRVHLPDPAHPGLGHVDMRRILREHLAHATERRLSCRGLAAEHVLGHGFSGRLAVRPGIHPVAPNRLISPRPFRTARA